MNQIQVTPQNIDAIIKSTDQHLKNIHERQCMIDAAIEAVDEADLVKATKCVLQYFASMADSEFKAISQQKEELEAVRLRISSGLIIPS